MRIAVFIFASLLAVAIASAQQTNTTGTNTVGTNTPEKKPATAKKTDTKPTSAKTTSINKMTSTKMTSLDVKTLMIEDLTVGKGKVAQKGKTIKVHYTGWLYDSSQPNNRGKQFASSFKHGEPFILPLGAGQVIKGWDEGLKDMKVGGKRKLTIPSDMAFGTRGADTVIPPNMPLIFEVELIDVMDVASGTPSGNGG